jgi:hypothetical protein
MMMFQIGTVLCRGDFGDRHYDNSILIPNYNSLQIKFHLKIFFFLLFSCILLFILHPFNIFLYIYVIVCVTPFQFFFFCLFVFYYKLL